MVKKKEVIRDYRMTDADLAQLGDKAVGLIERDLAQLDTYGIDDEDKDWIADTTEAFKNYPTDEELEGEVSDKTEEKDEAADVVKVDVRSIMVRVSNGFGEKSAKYRKFGTKGMDELDDNDLHRLGSRVERVATGYLAKLEEEGLTQDIIDALADKNKVFDDAIDAKDEAVRERDISTEDRIELANSLYAKIVKVFNAGKDYWVNKDEAKYNDYVIYEGGSTGGPLEGTVDGGATKNIMDGGFDDETNFLLQNTGTVSLTFCRASAGDVACSEGQAVEPGEEAAVVAADLGTGNFLNVTNPDSAGEAGSYKVTVNP